MKRKRKRILGAAMVATPFVALYVLMSLSAAQGIFGGNLVYGFLAVAGLFAGIALFFGLIVGGAYLLVR